LRLNQSRGRPAVISVRYAVVLADLLLRAYEYDLSGALVFPTEEKKSKLSRVQTFTTP
jgi:hypothetical protein